MSNQLERRAFLADTSRVIGSAWMAMQLPWLASLAGCATGDVDDDTTLTTLSPDEARAMRAFADRIIPSSAGVAGARHAGAVEFIDRALALPFFAESARVVHAGLTDLDARARAIAPRATFATLSVARQDAIIRAIEQEPFFDAARTLVIIGTFADPTHGGNRGGVGWAMIGMEHRPSYTAPFGWYDAQANARAGAA